LHYRYTTRINCFLFQTASPIETHIRNVQMRLLDRVRVVSVLRTRCGLHAVRLLGFDIGPVVRLSVRPSQPRRPDRRLGYSYFHRKRRRTQIVCRLPILYCCNYYIGRYKTTNLCYSRWTLYHIIFVYRLLPVTTIHIVLHTLLYRNGRPSYNNINNIKLLFTYYIIIYHGPRVPTTNTVIIMSLR